MQFQVPQFIEVEDKIFGPLTFKQFIYLAGGAGASFLLWRALPNFIAIIFIIPVAALVLGLAFYKVSMQPFAQVLESAVKYYLSSKLYLWKKEEKKLKAKSEKRKTTPPLYPTTVVPKLTKSRLQEISWALDINERIS